MIKFLQKKPSVIPRISLVQVKVVRRSGVYLFSDLVSALESIRVHLMFSESVRIFEDTIGI